MEESLIEKLKSYYFDYRSTAEPEMSFRLAMESLPHHVIDRIQQLASDHDLPGIRDILRQYEELQIAPAPSNDSVQERFENEFNGSTDRSTEAVR
jgi:hypothetical protein